MKVSKFAGRYLPVAIKRVLRRYIKARPTKARRSSNRWLRHHAAQITGRVLSVGSGTDQDGENMAYREYFVSAASYTTSEISEKFGSDLLLDVRDMAEIEDAAFDCILCNGVLEHCDDDLAALKEMHRVLRRGGILLIGLPLNQAIHLAPTDYRRYTEYGIRYLLDRDFAVLAIDAIETSVPNFPVAYWVKAQKRNGL